MTIKLRVIPLFICFLTACSSTPPHNSTVVTPQVDSDIVNMSGIGADGESNNLVGVKPMTFDELVACSTKISNIHKENALLKIDDAKLKKDKESLAKDNQMLELKRASVDLKNNKQVNEFNKAVEKTRIVASELNTVVIKFNQKIAALNTVHNDFNVMCANRAYRQSDFKRLPMDLRLATESRSIKSDLPLIDNELNQNHSSEKLHFPATPQH